MIAPNPVGNLTLFVFALFCHVGNDFKFLGAVLPFEVVGAVFPVGVADSVLVFGVLIQEVVLSVGLLRGREPIVF